MTRINRQVDVLGGRNDAPTPAKLLDLNGDQFEVSHSPLNFLLPSASARAMCNEASIVPSGPLVVPPATLLLLTSVERAVVVVIAAPQVALSLLVAETATALIPSEVPAIVLLARGSVPVRVHRSRLVSPQAVVVSHTAAILCVQRLWNRMRRWNIAR
jgi:hypothetical protein